MNKNFSKQAFLTLLTLLTLLTFSNAEQVTVTSQYPSPLGVYKKMRVLEDVNLAVSTGSVGIGTAVASEKMHVFGNVWVSGPGGFDASGESAFVYLGSPAGGLFNYIGASRDATRSDLYLMGNKSIVFRAGPLGTNLAAIVEAGNFFIGNYCPTCLPAREPTSPLHIWGLDRWDLVNTEGDFKIGDSNYRLKIGVAKSGAGRGDVRIRSHSAPATGGTNRLILGSDTNDTLTISGTNVGVGTLSPASALHVPSGRYFQAENSTAGAPPAADCDADAERGRLTIDTTNNRLYVCNGASRGWDYVTLTN